MDSAAAAEAALAEVARRGWSFGIHYPLVQKHAWDWAPFWFHPSGRGRAAALRAACRALQEAADLGAAYILFHFPWPALLDPGIDYPSAGWKIPPVSQDASLWPRERLKQVSENVLAVLAEAGRRSGIGVVLEPDGPNSLFFPRPTEPDLFTELLHGHPDLALCIDTGRFDLLARQHGGDPLEYVRRWLPSARHLHLHGANWDLRQNHLPPLPEHADQPRFAPAVAMARLVLSAHPQARIVMETNAAPYAPSERERSLRYCAEL